MATEPRIRLSVVVVSFSGLEVLDRCLQALSANADIVGEVLVVRRSEDALAQASALVARREDMRLVLVPSDATVPRMRHAGLNESRGDIVALIEDDCLVESEWAGAVVRAHAGTHVAIGGAVEPDSYERPLDWAAFFCDYARFMLPLPGGETAVLPGNNVSYKRAVVDELIVTGAVDGLQEAFVHDAWYRAGRTMKADPSIRVRNVHRWTAEAVSGVPFHHGRAFAGQRAAGWSVGKRLLYGCASVILPFLHTGRILERVLTRRRLVRPLWGALPWIVLFGVCWSAGECAGYLLGPGSSLQRWR